MVGILRGVCQRVELGEQLGGASAPPSTAGRVADNGGPSPLRRTWQAKQARQEEGVKAMTTKKQLSVPDQHQLRIAYQTMKMSDIMAAVMGGMTRAEAQAIIYRMTGKKVAL